MSLIEREKAITALEALYDKPISCQEISMAIDVIRAMPPADAAPWTSHPVEVAVAMTERQIATRRVGIATETGCRVEGVCGICGANAGKIREIVIERDARRAALPPTATWRGVFEEALSSYEAALAESNKPWGGADVAVEREAKRIKARLALIAAATGDKAIKGEL